MKKLSAIFCPFILSFFFIVSCDTSKNGEKVGHREIARFQLRNDLDFKSNEWTCTTVQYDRICFPKNWKILQQTKYLFLSQLEDNNKNTFFVVLRYDSEISNINIDTYLSEVHRQLSADTIEVIEDYSIKELIFNNKRRAIYGEFTTKIDNSIYITYAMYFEHHGLLYDLSLKVPLKSKENYYEIFQDILYNYQTQGGYLFPFDEKIKSYKSIDLSKY